MPDSPETLRESESSHIDRRAFNLPQKPALSLKEHTQNISRLVSIAVASCKIHTLTLLEDGGPFKLRPQPHIILNAHTGAVKSTILTKIASLQAGVTVIDDITKAGLIGSIDKQTTQLIPGAAWNCRNKVLLLDEFRYNRKFDEWVVFLKLLEDQSYTRKVAVFGSTVEKRDGDLFLTQCDGLIDMKTRFSAIIATMRSFKTISGQYFKAFINRCIPYQYNPKLPELKRLVESGASLIELTEYTPAEHVIIENSDFTRILNFIHKQIIVDNDTARENYLRILGDICRIYAVEGKFDWTFASQIINWKLTAYNEIGEYQTAREHALEDRIKQKLRGGDLSQ